MKKRFLCVFLTLCMLFTLSAVALAADTDAQDAARSLYELGLFKGVGTNDDGTPNFDLDRTPTRAEAVTMLIRLLGMENEAQSGSWETPFTDVPEWAMPYVGCAYEKGLTMGTGATTFSSGDPVSATQYLTFVLRALGYSSDGDFKWDAAWELSDELGMTGGEYSADSNDITRGGMVIVSSDAMGANLKDSDRSLIEKLTDEGAVDAGAAIEQGYLMPESGIRIVEGEDGLVIAVSNQDALIQALHQSEKVASINIKKSFVIDKDCGVNYEEGRIDNYSKTVITIEKGVTLTVAEGGQTGNYWFTYEGDWQTEPLPNAKIINNGRIIVEKDGWINGAFDENNGEIIVKDGGQCQTMPDVNNGTVTVESGGSYRTTQNAQSFNYGTITIAEGANMVTRFGSTLYNRGTIVMDGLFAVGCVTFTEEVENEEGQTVTETHANMWFENGGDISGTGTVRLYDNFGGGDGPFVASDMSGMEAHMRGMLGDDTQLKVIIGEGTGV